MGKLIAIEGGDGSGKETQAKMLVDELRDDGLVAYFDFPQYDGSTFGGLIRQALHGEFGDFRRLPPELASPLFMLDRVTARGKMIQALSRGHVVCNRYVPSNVAHQTAKLERKRWDAFIRQTETSEYVELELPRPDVVVYLNVAPEVASRLLLKKKRKKDRHERDLRYQKDVALVYQYLCRRRDDWINIPCVKRGSLLAPEEVHQLVLEAVRPLLTTAAVRRLR